MLAKAMKAVTKRPWIPVAVLMTVAGIVIYSQSLHPASPPEKAQMTPVVDLVFELQECSGFLLDKAQDYEVFIIRKTPIDIWDLPKPPLTS